jgi:hypothetical protein
LIYLNTKNFYKTYTNKSFKQLFILTLIILLIPFFGSIFIKEVNWSFFDYLLGGVLIHLFLAGVYFLKFPIKLSKGKKYF